MIEQRDIDELKSYCDMVAIAEDLGGHTFHPNGPTAHKGFCLFHEERSGSMFIYEDSDNYHCFGCGAHGDLVTMVQEKLACDFTDAIRYLSKHAGYVPPGLTDIEGKELTPVKPKGKPKEKKKRDGRIKWETIWPVPDKAPRPAFDRFKASFPGQPPREAVAIWPYYDGKKQLLGVDVRYEYFSKPKGFKKDDVVKVPEREELDTVIAISDDGMLETSSGTYAATDCQRKSKDVITWTWCRRIADGVEAWRMRRWDHPMPLYGLDRIYENADAVIIIAEGCKAADAANELDGYVGVTWPGGSNAIAEFDRVNWAACHDRDFIIWPDADEPGLHAAAMVYKHLNKAGARSAHIVNVLDLPKGWDLADANA